MTARLLDGKLLASQLQAEIADRVEHRRRQGLAAPCLAAVLVGDDPASQVYVRNKSAACRRCGLESRLLRLEGSASSGELLGLVRTLNDDPAVHGILVQLPLPPQIEAASILDAIAPHKDVDCFHPENVGLLMQGRPRFLPCTPHGVLQLLERNQLSAAGKRVAVIGRSEIVGKPLGAMFVQKSLPPLRDETVNATVTWCHSRTAGLAEVVRQADIVVAAIGRPNFVTADMIRPGAVVIDVGINRTDQGLVGDVDFEAARQVAAWITPVPGGVGPLTVTMLLHNTLRAAELASPA